MIRYSNYKRVIGCIVFLLLVVSGVQAQENFVPDPLIEAGLEQGLFTELDLSQTSDEATVSLNWVYVDTQQIMLSYTITGAEPVVFMNPFQNAIILNDSTGAMFSYASLQPVTQPESDSTTFLVNFYNQAVVETENGESEVINDYFHTNFESVPESVDLQLELNYESFEVEDWMPVDPATSEYQVGDTVEGIGPFTFDFSAPVYESIQLQPMQSVTVNDIEVTLEALSVAPMAGEARVCYDLPDERDWLPEASVTVEGVAGHITGQGITDMAQFENMERRCRDVRFDVFYNGEGGNLTLSLDYLTTSMAEGPEDWERIEAVLAEEGIDIDVIFSQGENGGGGIGIEQVDVPEDFDLQSAINRAREQLGDRMAGPWVFEVELP